MRPVNKRVINKNLTLVLLNKVRQSEFPFQKNGKLKIEMLYRKLVKSMRSDVDVVKEPKEWIPAQKAALNFWFQDSYCSSGTKKENFRK